jgi:hypothetical protein
MGSATFSSVVSGAGRIRLSFFSWIIGLALINPIAISMKCNAVTLDEEDKFLKVETNENVLATILCSNCTTNLYHKMFIKEYLFCGLHYELNHLWQLCKTIACLLRRSSAN